MRILGVSVNLAEDWNRKRRNNQNYGKFGFAGGCGYLLACAGSFFGCFSSNSCRANMSAQRDQNSKTETKTSTSMNMCRSYRVYSFCRRKSANNKTIYKKVIVAGGFTRISIRIMISVPYLEL